MKKIFILARLIIRKKPLLAVGIVFLTAFLAGGLIFGYFSKKSYVDISAKKIPERQVGSEYKFTSPLLDCNSFGGPFALRSDNVREKVESIISQNISRKILNHTSVFFRDLNNGPTMGINEEEEFTPASLLKVPLMMAYLKKAQEDPTVLKEKILFKAASSESFNQNIKPNKKLEKGKEYEVEELIERMIASSDNDSAGLLLENISQDFLGKVYTDLGIEIPSMSNTENFMTVREYASFFRILYNSSYLSRDMSEKALGFLSQSQYLGGLKSGVPDDVSVAHKFGERVFENSNQLHDCGIVYHARSPYLLCIMSRGDNFPELENTIQSISLTVFQEVDKE
jgi:beta-lactamase class A